MKSNRLFLLFVAMVLMLSACGEAPERFTPTAPVATQAPLTPPPATEFPQSLSVEEQLAQVDDILKRSTKGSIGYNGPSEMRVDETVTIELLLNPVLSEEELKKQISEPGTIVTKGNVEITTFMKATLVSQAPSTFLVKALPDEEHAVQVISDKETTKWSWNVTAQKSGTHRLTIFLSRLVKYDNKESWREVGEYQADIVVQVTAISWLKDPGWKWIAGLAIALVAIFAIQRGRVQRKRRSKQTGKSKAASLKENAGRIFISYRRADSADIVGRIYDYLVDEFGRDPIFKDVNSIPLGIDFKEFLDKKVSECRVLLAILGDHWLDASDNAGKRRLEDPDDFVRIEIQSALERDIPVIPLLVRGAQMPREQDLPSSLRKLVYKNGIPVRPDPDFHHDMKRLISALKQYIG